MIKVYARNVTKIVKLVLKRQNVWNVQAIKFYKVLLAKMNVVMDSMQIKIRNA